MTDYIQRMNMTISSDGFQSRFSDCPCCGSSQFETIYFNKNPQPINTPSQFFFGGRRFIQDIYGCVVCGFRFINHLPKNYENLYDEKDVGTYCDLTGPRREYFRRVKQLLETKTPLTVPKETAILDLGCGAGDWLELWKTDHQLYGTEVSQALHPLLKAKGIEIITLPDHSGIEFELVSMFDFLEHVENPLIFLKEIHGHLKPRGYVVMGVPDMNKLAARLLGTRYYLYCPMHFSYFNRRALSKIVERVFGPSSILSLFPSPAMKSDLDGIAKWLGMKLPTTLNFTIPLGYSASLILTAQKT